MVYYWEEGLDGEGKRFRWRFIAIILKHRRCIFGAKRQQGV